MNATATPCPDLHDLHGFLLGRDGDGLLEEHLLDCPACTAAAGTLDPSDEVLDAARDYATLRQAHGPTAPDALLDRLKQLGPTGPPALTAHDYEPFLDPPATPGDVGRLGPYRLLRLLGTGGMGAVFLAEEEPLGRPVALKLPRPSCLADPTARRRFLREARAAAAVVSDHVVPIYRVGEERSVPFLAMPRLAGESLADRLDRAGPLSLADAARLGRDLARGLAAVHACGLVHRDVKPANVWLEPVLSADGAPWRARLLDFGLATGEPAGPVLTEPGMLVGTPAYMAPEQARGEPADARADLFSLGSVLFTALAGQPPCPTTHPLASLHAVATDDPVSLGEAAPHVPPALAALVDRLRQKDPAARFPSAEAAADAFDDCLTSGQLAPPRPRRRIFRLRRDLAAAALLLGVTGLALAGAARVGHRDTPPPPAAPAPAAPVAAVPEALAMLTAPPAEPEKPRPAGPPALAVLPFEERGPGAKDQGSQVADLLFAKLSTRDNLLMVDRADLAKSLKELELGLSGAVKPDTAPRVGQLTGARLLLYGSVLHADKRRYLIAKLVGVETGQVLGLTVDSPASDELAPQVAALADKVADALARQAGKLLPAVQAPTDRLAALRQRLGDKKRPVLWIQLPERAVGVRVADPAAQTELIRLARALGFPVVDEQEGARGTADVLITGEGLSELGGRRSELATAKARVELKAVDRATGRVITADRQGAVVVDLTEQLAGKAALQQAAAALADRLFPQLVK